MKRLPKKPRKWAGEFDYHESALTPEFRGVLDRLGRKLLSLGGGMYRAMNPAFEAWALMEAANRSVTVGKVKRLVMQEVMRGKY